MMPERARQTPRNRLSGISSPKSRQPPLRTTTVLMWPTTAQKDPLPSQHPLTHHSQTCDCHARQHLGGALSSAAAAFQSSKRMSQVTEESWRSCLR